MKDVTRTDVERASREKILTLLKPSAEQLAYTNSCRINEDEDLLIIKAPIMTALQIAVNAWKSFVYTGLSYDYILLQPSFHDSKNEADVSWAKLTIATCNDPNLNKLKFKIKRR